MSETDAHRCLLSILLLLLFLLLLLLLLLRLLLSFILALPFDMVLRLKFRQLILKKGLKVLQLANNVKVRHTDNFG